MSESDVAVKPDWLDDDFLKTCILNSEGLPQATELDVGHVHLSYAVPKGENYMSLIFRVNVGYHIHKSEKGKQNGALNGAGGSSRELSLIIKACHEAEDMKWMNKESQIFAKETDMYVNLLPKLSRALEDAGLNGVLSCRCLHSVLDGDRDLLVVEDLRPKGYVLANRLLGLDLQHCKLVFNMLAKLHASSMFYYHSAEHEVPEWYRRPAFEMKDSPHFDAMKKMFEESMKKKTMEVTAELSRYPQYKKHIEFFKQYGQAGIDVVHRDWKLVPGNKFNGINHGDCWVNNMLFKYDDDGSVEDVMLIDLQISHYSSIANDFLYFFFTSSNREVRTHHFKTLQKFYVDSLNGYLQKLGYEGVFPTLEEFDAELKRVGLLAINHITNTNSIILAELEDKEKERNEGQEAFSMDELMDLMQKKAKSRKFLDVLLLSIDVLEENGFFECLNVYLPSENNNII